jgi:PAS domain S-box-containing protein
LIITGLVLLLKINNRDKTQPIIYWCFIKQGIKIKGMDKLDQKTRKRITRYMQILFVVLAFTLMVIASYLFVSSIEREHLTYETMAALNFSEVKIEEDLMEPQTLMGSISQTIRSMIMSGYNQDAISRYMADISNNVIRNENRKLSSTGVYGLFEVFGNKFIDLEWTPPADYVPQDRPWYKTAVAAEGKIAVTPPYMDIRTKSFTIAYVVRIFDDNNTPLAVLSMNVPIDRISEYIVETRLAEGGYGLLLSEDLEVIAHPHKEGLGMHLRKWDSGLAEFADELEEKKKDISERRLINYKGDDSIVSFRRLENGWYLGIVTPYGKYYQTTRSMALFLTVLGSLLAMALIAVLLVLFRQMNKENEKSQTMAHWYNSILNAIPLPISVTDVNTNWTFINTRVEQILGIKLKDAIGKPCSNWGSVVCNTENCGILCAKKGITQTYFSDENYSFQVDTAVLKDLNSKIMGYIEVAHDVTNMKLLAKKQADAEAQINQSKQSLNILTNILNGIDAQIYVIVPHTGEILFVNDYMKKQFNLEGDCTGQLCYKLFLKGQDELCEFCPCYELDKNPNETVVWERRNPFTNRIYRNTDRYIEWTDGKTAQIQHTVDITEIIDAKEHAEQSNRFKSQFLSHMSHEIRTPMNAILGITEIQLQNETLSNDMQEALSRIYNSGYLLLGIINDILDLSKIEAGKLEIIPINYDVPSLINDTVHLNIMRFDNKPIVFDLNVDENIPLTLFGDELRIKQILNNLLSNAFKYTDSGKVSLSISIEPSDKPSMTTLLFRVSDTGQGMTREQLDKLFDEYTRFNLEANRATEGAGLGMNITRRLVELMNGEISVESEQGKGSVFTVRLPQGIVDGGVLGKAIVENLMQFRLGKMSQMKKAPQVVREYMPYGKVLVVDDLETNLYVANGLMSPYGLTIDTAVSGFEAIEKIKNGASYDIIFMDHFMPKMDGIEAAKKIRDLGYKQPIIALTANALTGQTEVFLANGFDGYISKPIDIHQLNAVLNKLVRDRHPEETVEAVRRQKSGIEKSAAEQVNQELAKIFMRDAKKAIAVLETIHANNYRRVDDMQMYIINVHAMKSALANIGEEELSAFARKLEEAGRERDITRITEETPEFLSALRAVIEKNKLTKDGNENADNIPYDDMVYLSEKLTEIKKACAEQDKKTAKDTLSHLREKKWPQPVAELLEKMAEHLLHSEFAESAKMAEDYINNGRIDS